MSASPGKILIDGVQHIQGEDVFCLQFLQGRSPSWEGKPFLAKYDAEARWIDDLRPAFGEKHFFFEKEFEAIYANSREE